MDAGDFMQADNLYREIFENATEGIYQTTITGRFITANSALASILGYETSDELLEDTLDIADKIYVDSNRRNQFRQAIENDGKVSNFISQVYKKDRTIIWIAENARVVYNNRGDIYCYEGFVSDITPVKAMAIENQLADITFYQKEKDTALQTLSRGLGHDLNNILSPILGYTEMLLEVFTHDAKVEKYIQSIYRSTKRARDLVQHIHYLGKTGPTITKPFHISNVAAGVVQSLTPKLSESIKISLNIDQNIKQINGDSFCYEQILFNLCENGIQAMDTTGGILEIAIIEKYLSSEEIQKTRLDLEAGNYVVIKVTDSGEGINPYLINRIFDPYFSTRNLGIGHGLGLATVQSLVRSCCGTITVSSQPGQGSEFYVYMPQYQSVIKKEKTTDAQNSVQLTPKHIMLVDDDDDVLQIQQQLIEHLGYRVTSFSDSQQALQSFSQNPGQYDLVLTDMNMPKMSGLILSKQLLHINAKIPIILCSGFIESINEATAKSVGIRRFIIKPLTTQKLSQDLENVLKEKDNLFV